MRLELVTPPAVEPVSVEEAKLHARIDSPDEDAYVAGLIVAARQSFEAEVRRAAITQAWEMALDGFPAYPGRFFDRDRCEARWIPTHGRGVVGVPLPRLQSVESITYVDPDGAILALDPAAYRVVAGTPGLIEPAYGATWPATRPIAAAVIVRFTAGYGDAAADVPECVKAGMKMLIAHLYENREAAVIEPGLTPITVPLGVQYLWAAEAWGSYP